MSLISFSTSRLPYNECYNRVSRQAASLFTCFPSISVAIVLKVSPSSSMTTTTTCLLQAPSSSHVLVCTIEPLGLYPKRVQSCRNTPLSRQAVDEFSVQTCAIEYQSILVESTLLPLQPCVARLFLSAEYNAFFAAIRT